MMARTFSAFQQGINGQIVHIEAAGQPLPPQIQVTGLPAEVVRESRERIRVALSQLGYTVPREKIVVHLSPANARKEGSQFDLPIALAILCAEQFLTAASLRRAGFLGELALDGQVRKVRNIIPLVLALVVNEGIEHVYVPEANAAEVSLLKDPRIVVVQSLGETIECLSRKRPRRTPPPGATFQSSSQSFGQSATGGELNLPSISLDDVQGHHLAKRALEITLAGRHHLLLIGSPGVGKSMLAGTAGCLLPPLLEKELVEIAVIQNAITDHWQPSLVRPFRSPHHSVSVHGFVGGGTGRIIPGELSLSHRGVLFLDELPEFRRDALEGLRQPLQNGEIHIHRLGHSYQLPARFTLIAAMNPCPCGMALDPYKRCLCSREKVLAYRKRVSGPILDRLQLGVVMSNPDREGLIEREIREGRKEDDIKKNIKLAWDRQFARLGQGVWNNDAVDLNAEGFHLSSSVQSLLDSIIRSKHPSMRVRHKLIRVARTLADLEGDFPISTHHLEEAWALRCPDIHALNT